MLSIPCFLLPSSFGLRFCYFFFVFSPCYLCICTSVGFLFFSNCCYYMYHALYLDPSQVTIVFICQYQYLSILIFGGKYHDITLGWCRVQRITSPATVACLWDFWALQVIVTNFQNNRRVPNKWPKGRCTTNIPLTSVSIGSHNTDPCRDRRVPYFQLLVIITLSVHSTWPVLREIDTRSLDIKQIMVESLNIKHFLRRIPRTLNIKSHRR